MKRLAPPWSRDIRRIGRCNEHEDKSQVAGQKDREARAKEALRRWRKHHQRPGAGHCLVSWREPQRPRNAVACVKCRRSRSQDKNAAQPDAVRYEIRPPAGPPCGTGSRAGPAPTPPPVFFRP
jgi:hypothetical protein